MTKYFIGMAGALVGALVGAWLILAPSALAYQPAGAAWADPTITDFWSGLGILIISLVGLVMYAMGLVGELRRRGIVEQRREPTQEDQLAAQEVQASGMPASGAQSGSGDIEQILLPLVTAMLQDMQDQRRREEDGGTSQQSPQQNAVAPTSQRPDQERRTQQ